MESVLPLLVGGDFMKKRIFLLAMVLMLTVCSVYAAQTVRQQAALAEKLVRLHVVAASDSEHDQAVKLRVRDAVLQCVEKLVEGCTDAGQARARIAQQLPQIETAANRCLQACGEQKSACVSLRNEQFPTRTYETFALPAGVYAALRVEIGEAEGHNWWCVVYPALCTPAAAEDFEETAQAGGFSEEETQWLTESKPQYTLRFKSLEYLQKLFSLFR